MSFNRAPRQPSVNGVDTECLTERLYGGPGGKRHFSCDFTLSSTFTHFESHQTAVASDRNAT